MAGVRDLVDRQGVIAFVGGVGTASGVAVQRYLRQNKLSGSVYALAPRLLLNRTTPIFGTCGPHDDDASVMAKFLVEKIQKIGMLYQNDDYGLDSMAGAKDA